MNELEWFPVKGYEELYHCTKCGKIKSLPRVRRAFKGYFQNIKGKILVGGRTKDGYQNISVPLPNNKNIKIRGHRMIAETFIPNPMNYPMVNHKNGIKDDNRVENLEWCNNQQNTKHAYDNGWIKAPINIPKLTGENIPARKPVDEFDLNGNFIMNHVSIKHCALFHNSCPGSISRVIYGQRKQHKQKVFKFSSTSKQLNQIQS